MESALVDNEERQSKLNQITTAIHSNDSDDNSAVSISTSSILQSNASIAFDTRGFAAGSCAGVAIVLSGQPLDVIKTRIQVGFKPSNVSTPATASTASLSTATTTSGLRCALITIRHEGIFALYKGALAPLSTVPLINAIVFASYEQAKRGFNSNNNKQSNELSIAQIGAAGAYAGLMNSPVVCLMEHIKCRLQVAYTPVNTMMKPPSNFSVVCSIVATLGFKGLLKGHFATVLRELPCYAAQFTCYEFVKRKLTECTASSSQAAICEISTSVPSTAWISLLAGGFGGLACWTVSFPQDVIKSRLQTQALDKSQWIYQSRFFDGGFSDCAVKLVREGGWMSLWRGFGPCALRAIIANAVGFLTYETAMQAINTTWPRNKPALNIT